MTAARVGGKDGGAGDRCIHGWGRAARKMLATPRPFIALIRRQAASDFHVSFPDFPGCVSSGRTIAEARRNAEHALAAQCWRLRHAGRPVPPPSFIRELGLGGGSTDTLIVLVPPPALFGPG